MNKINEITTTNNIDMPKHVAIIMDGNGRWAKKQHKMRVFGHKKGLDAVKTAVSFALENGIKTLTLYAFSSENWNREPSEVNALMDLFLQALTYDSIDLNKNDIKLNILGDISAFNKKLVKKIVEVEAKTINNQSLCLNIAANYGGKWDILQAAKKLALLTKEQNLDLANFSENDFSQLLVTTSQPEVDLLIRTGGEVRISNFLLWQMAYSELYFCETLWPDFSKQDFLQAVTTFQKRERRFGCAK